MEFFITIASFLFFTSLVGFLTWRITRGSENSTTAGYFLAGRSLTFPLIAGSLLLTNLSTEQMVGLNGDAFTNGFCVMVWEVVSVISMVFMAWFFLPRFLKSGIATVPQYLRLRFDSQTETITNVIFLIAYVGILLPMILFTGARGMSDILDVSGMIGTRPALVNSDIDFDGIDDALDVDATGGTDANTNGIDDRYDSDIALVLIIWVVGIIGSIYALFGGLKTVAVSDTINGVGLLIGGFLITYFALSTLGGDAGVSGGVQRIRDDQATRMNSVGSTESLVPFGEVFSGIFLLTLFYWATNQQIIQRTFGASSLAEGQKGVLLTGALKLLGPIYLVLPGMIAYSMFAGDVEVQPKEIVVAKSAGGTNMNLTLEATHGGRTKELNVPLKFDQAAFWSKNPAIHQTGPITTNDKDNPKFDYDMLGMLKPAKAYGRLVNTVLPKPLVGFFAAVMLGAILSSFNSALNSSCTLFSLGLYKNLIAKNATEQQVVGSSKVFGIVIAIMAMLIAPTLAQYSSIFDYLQKMNGMYSVPILAVVLVGMLSKRVPPMAAKLALVVGFGVIALGNFVPPFTTIAASMGKGFYFLGTVFSWLVVMMFVIGELRPSETEWVQEDAGAVDMTPWRLSGMAGVVLIVAVIAIYACFAKF